MTIEAGPKSHHSISRRALSLLMLGGAAATTVADERGSSVASGLPVKADDLAQIEQLLHRHSQALDQRDPQALIECFAPGVLPPELAQRVITFYRRFEYTLHRIVNPIYRMHGDSATGTAFCLVNFIKNEAGKRTGFDTISQYQDDRLTRHNGRWLFLQHHRTSLYSTKAVEMLEGDPPEVTQAVRDIFG